jgi:hypothetical protein
VLSVSQAVNDIVISSGCLPKHDTTKLLRVTLNVGRDEGLGLIRRNVETSVGSTLGCGKTDVELSVRVGTRADSFNPSVEVEMASSVDPVGSGAAGGVVELHPDEVKDGVQDSGAELGVGAEALRGTGDVECLFSGLSVVHTETINHGRPSLRSVVLNIEIESINRNTEERTGKDVDQGRCPRQGGAQVVVGTKGVPQEISKPFTGGLIRKRLGSGRATTDGEEDLLASSLAQGNILPDLVTAREEAGTLEKVAITLVGKVRAREFTNSRGELVNETDVDDVHGGLGTEVGEAVLACTLSVVDGNIVLCSGIKSNGS